MCQPRAGRDQASPPASVPAQLVRSRQKATSRQTFIPSAPQPPTRVSHHLPNLEEPDTMTSLRTTLIASFVFQSVLVEGLALVVGGVLLLAVGGLLFPDRDPIARWLTILTGRHPPSRKPPPLEGGRP